MERTASSGGNWGVYPLFGDDKILASDRQSGLWVLSIGSLQLEVTNMVRGEPVTFRATGGQPGELVRFLGSSNGAGMGPCPPQLGGLCLGIEAPIQSLGTAVVDGSGVAEFESTVPPNAPFDDAWIQAVIVRGPDGTTSVSSNVVSKTVFD